MKYSLRNKRELEKKLGQGVLDKLFQLISSGTIERHHLKNLSYQHNMNVYTTYSQGVVKEDLLEVIFQDMLDRWYEESVWSF